MIELPYLSKPRLHEPCNGCGFCCQNEVCELGLLIVGSHQAPCEMLVYKDGRTFCGAALGSELVARMLGIGKGCCSSDTDSESADTFPKEAA